MLILIVMCCVSVSQSALTAFEPLVYRTSSYAVGYAIDYNFDGTFDRWYGTPRDEDVRVGLPSWGEARGQVEFRVSNIPLTKKDYRDVDGDDNFAPTLYLDKIYLKKYWFSASNQDADMSLYGYVGDGRAYGDDVYKLDNLLLENISRYYGSIDVTDFVRPLMGGSLSFAGFVLKETKQGSLVNYGSFYLDATYIPEPMTLFLLFTSGIFVLTTKIK